MVPGGGLIAVQKVGEGASEFGFGFPWTVADGRAGRDPFKAALPDVRGVMSGFGSSYLQFVIDKRFGATSMDEIFKKKMPIRIAVDRVGTTDELALRRVLAFYKMTYEDLAKAGGQGVPRRLQRPGHPLQGPPGGRASSRTSPSPPPRSWRPRWAATSCSWDFPRT